MTNRQHFTEHSSSLIDLILTNNVNMLIYTGVGSALNEQIRYHYPVIDFIHYPKTPTKPFKRKIWLYEHADYEKLRQNLFNVNWDSLFLTDDIELITNDITNAILSTGTRIPDPPFPHLVPPAIMVWIFVWKYIFEPFIHILQHFVLQLSRSTNFCF